MEVYNKILQLEHKLDAVLLMLKSASSGQAKAMLDTDEAAAYLGLSTSTIYKHTSAGSIAFYKPNGKLMFKKEDLDNWIKQRRIPSTQELLNLKTPQS